LVQVAALSCLSVVASNGQDVQGDVFKKMMLVQFIPQDIPYCLELSLSLMCGVLSTLPPDSISEVSYPAPRQRQ
jgi:hypothetical protein